MSISQPESAPTNNLHTSGTMPNGINSDSCSDSSKTINGNHDAALETEFLVVGAGPAGAGLACFLTSHGE